MKFLLKTQQGAVEVPGQQIEQLRAQGQLRDNMPIISIDKGRTWLTYPQAVAAYQQLQKRSQQAQQAQPPQAVQPQAVESPPPAEPSAVPVTPPPPAEPAAEPDTPPPPAPPHPEEMDASPMELQQEADPAPMPPPPDAGVNKRPIDLLEVYPTPTFLTYGILRFGAWATLVGTILSGILAVLLVAASNMSKHVVHLVIPPLVFVPLGIFETETAIIILVLTYALNGVPIWLHFKASTSCRLGGQLWKVWVIIIMVGSVLRVLMAALMIIGIASNTDSWWAVGGLVPILLAETALFIFLLKGYKGANKLHDTPPQKEGIKGRPILAGFLILLCCGLVNGVGYGVGFAPAFIAAGNKAQEIRCEINLRNIGSVIHQKDAESVMYRSGGASLPESLDSFVEKGDLEPKHIRCPATGKRYTYIRDVLPAEASARINSLRFLRSSDPIVWDSEPHPTGTMKVLFVDGHCSTLTREQFQERLSYVIDRFTR